MNGSRKTVLFFKAIFPYLITGFCSLFCRPNTIFSEDYESARKDMVEVQLKSRGIYDKAICQALLRVPRHLVVDPEYLSQVYSNFALPIKENQAIFQLYSAMFKSDACFRN
jgi:hypothetical protein